MLNIIIIEESFDNMKIRNLNEGVERRVNPNREPRGRRPIRRKDEGVGELLAAGAIGGAAAGIAGSALKNVLGEERPMKRMTRGNRRGLPTRRERHDIDEGRGCRGRDCGTKKGFPTKRVEREALERTDMPNMARRRPIGKTRRER